MVQVQPLGKDTLIKNFVSSNDPKRLLLTVLIVSVILGTITGFILSRKSTGGFTSAVVDGPVAKDPESDTRTFRDFAEGTVKVRPQPSDSTEYVEGTHVLVRQGAVPVALTSSVVDLSQYENKKVKVFGETQKALKEGWLMDVGKVEEVK